MMPSLASRLPISEECERALLASVLLTPDLFSQMSARVKTEYFGFERHRAIWRAFLEVEKDEVEIDLRTTQAKLEECGDSETVGGMAYLAELDFDLPDLGRWSSYCDIVIDRFSRRELFKFAKRIERDIFERGVPVADLFNRWSDDVAKLRSATPGGSTWHEPATLFGEAWEYVYTDGRQKGALATGFSDLDAVLEGGFYPGELIILGGRPGHGKSTLALNIADHITRSGSPVGFVSLEMLAKEEIALKLFASRSSIPFSVLRSGRVPEFQAQELQGVASELMRRKIHITDSWVNTNITSILASCDYLVSQKSAKAIFVDYLQLTEGVKAENRNLALGQITRTLKQAAKRWHVPVIVLAQLSRRADERPNHYPTLGDLRESGNIEQDANMVAFIVRQELYEAPGTEAYAKVENRAELIIAKSRNTKTNRIVDLWFEGAFCRFRSLHKP